MNSTPMRTETRITDGLEIRYADSRAEGSQASGPVILLTSPWPESLLAFRRVWPALFATGRLIAVDLPGFGHSQGRPELFTPGAMAEFLRQLIGELGAGPVHLVAPDIGTGASLFLAARHPDVVRSVVTGGGAAAYPLDVSGALADIIAAPGIEAFEGQDIRATIGATVEPVAPRAEEPEVWEDYVTAYENGRFAQSARYVRSYPRQLAALSDLLPSVRVPVHVVVGAGDPLVPVSNGTYLAERIPRSQLSVLDAGHFAWEEAPGQYAAAVADWVAHAEQQARNRVG
jgi:pimeloyl-ACP methyl ester carboxylesterase